MLHHKTDSSMALGRDTSNQSTVDSGSGLSMNSHTDPSATDPNATRRMFSLTSSTGADMQRRLRLIIDQCETVRFPFKKRLILANLSLSHDDIPVQDICSERLGSALYKLSLAGNQILTIPEPLVLKLAGLRVLDVSQCGLRTLPDVWDLPSLRKLVVSHNRIQIFPSESVFQGLPELQQLEFYRNKVASIPPLSDPGFLAKLEYLDMGDNQLGAIPVELAKLPSLKTLKFVNNLIEVIPAEICEMDLRVLDVSSNPLMQPPLETCQRGLQSMRRYYHCLKLEEMVRQDLAHIPSNESMFKKKMTERRLSMKKLKDSTKKAFPSALTRSSMFRTSSDHASSSSSGNYLSSTTSLPTTLKSDQSSFGDGDKMPPFIRQRESAPTRSVSMFDAKERPPHSKGVSFSNDSKFVIENASAENLLHGGEKIPDKITVNDTLKVIFVGMALSGKTSIIKRLIGGKDAKIPEKDERTIGVDIYEWDPKSSESTFGRSLMTQIPVEKELESRMGGNVDVKFSVWDFAGQHVYHATHELFFSSQSLYVLVWDMGVNNPNTNRRRSSFKDDERGAFKLTYDSSDEEEDFFSSEQETRRSMRALEQDIDEKLQFWIECIQSSVPGAAILPVASFDDYFADGGTGDEEATMRCTVMRERLQKHEERRVKSMNQRLKDYESKFGASSELAVRLRTLLNPFNRPKIIFGSGGADSVIRVSSTNFSGFDNLAERIVNIATGRERGGWAYPIFRGHIGARIPRMRLEVKDTVRSMRERFKVVEWNFFLSELWKRSIVHSAADVSDALLFLANIGELSYFGGFATSQSVSSCMRPSTALLIPNTNIISITETIHCQNVQLAKNSPSLYEHRTSELVDDEYSSTSHHHLSGTSDLHDSTASLGLSNFVFLNPRWLVAAVACILRHDLSTEIYEIRRALHIVGGHPVTSDVATLNGEHPLEMEQTTDINYPVITAHDAWLLWQNKKFTKKAAERALQYADDKSISPYDFLERLLVRFGVFVPIDVSICRYLGGKDCFNDLSDNQTVAQANEQEVAQAPRYFFLPSLLGPGDPYISDIWTFKTIESWKTTICHSLLFPDVVPPGLMERMIASILSDLYTHPRPEKSTTCCVSQSYHPSRIPAGQLKIKEILCWRSALFLKIGSGITDNSTGIVNESIVEIFASLVDQDSQLCVASDSMGVGMHRLIFSGKGLAGDTGSKIWNGGYKRVLQKAVQHVLDEYSGLEIERQAVCPQCLAKKPICQASVWDHSTITSLRERGEKVMRCRYGHINDVRLICGTTDESQNLSKETHAAVGDTDIAVSDLLKAVVIVGIWNEKLQRIVKAGSGFIVDKKRGFVISAGHTLMDHESWREVKGKIVIGVIPNTSSRADPVAVFRYFARILVKDPSINGSGICKIDACVLQITTRMENDVLESGREIGEQPETLLMNNPAMMKKEGFMALKVSQKFELDEAVRILGFNQGGEGLIGPGEELNRCADFARGYVVMKFAVYENSEQTLHRKFQPRSEIVAICPTIGGHSGGPCVNQQGEVIGILSRADPADKQRCYLVPTSEWLPLVKIAKEMLSSSRMF